MELYSSNESYKLYQGNMLDMLDVIESNSIDSIITDPPYELNFMSKGWDNAGVSFQSDTWKKCYEVLKTGGYLLAFGGSRTFHRIACAIEDAGFEIRDTIMWLYGSGFPKSMDISKSLDKKMGFQGKKIGERTFGKTSTGQNSGWNNNNIAMTGKQDVFAPATDLAKQWEGWGTALKPSFEPIIVARKPFKGSLVDNVIENGVGGINIDECRVETNEDLTRNCLGRASARHEGYYRPCFEHAEKKVYGSTNGRFPANTILTYDETPSDERLRYFYCAKASKKDRDEGLDEFEEKRVGSLAGGDNQKEVLDDVSSRFRVIKRNIHPTVKPTSLMQYLVRLVTPNNGIILDPFNGSGSTGKAVMYENKERNKNYKYIGIELTEEYLPISKARIEYVWKLAEEEKNEERQLSIYDLQ